MKAASYGPHITLRIVHVVGLYAAGFDIESGVYTVCQGDEVAKQPGDETSHYK